MTVTSQTTYDKYRILINGTVHLSIQKPIEAIWTYKDDSSRYGIHIATRYNSIECEYDSEEKWKMVINEMVKCNMI